MEVREMKLSDIKAVLPMYLAYYNDQEDGCWTEESAGKRIHQVLSMEDSYSLILEDGNLVLGFVMGYFKQYDDIVGYTLEEIVIAFEHQNKGIGSALLQEIERQVRERGLPVWNCRRFLMSVMKDIMAKPDIAMRVIL